MKMTSLIIITLLFTAPLAQAQYAVAVVADPIAMVNQSEDIAKWTQSIATLDQQLQQMEQVTQLAQTMKSYIGDPAAAGAALHLQLLGPQLSTVGQLTAAINQSVNGATALANQGSPLFSPVTPQTPSGFAMSFDSTQFKTYAAIQSQNANVAGVIQDTTAQIAGLQAQKAATLAQIQAAPDQSTVQKLTAQASAIDGQIAALGQQQQTATNQIVTQAIANQNDQQLKAQAANQSADHEMNLSLQNIMQWQSHIASNRTEFN